MDFLAGPPRAPLPLCLCSAAPSRAQLSEQAPPQAQASAVLGGTGRGRERGARKRNVEWKYKTYSRFNVTLLGVSVTFHTELKVETRCPISICAFSQIPFAMPGDKFRIGHNRGM